MAFCRRLPELFAHTATFAAFGSWLRKEGAKLFRLFLGIDFIVVDAFFSNVRRLLARMYIRFIQKGVRCIFLKRRSQHAARVHLHSCVRVMRSINIENSDAENMDLMHLQRQCTRDLSPSALVIVSKPFVIFPSRAVAIILLEFPVKVRESLITRFLFKLNTDSWFLPNFFVYLFMVLHLVNNKQQISAIQKSSPSTL